MLRSYGIVQFTLEGDSDFCDQVTYMATFVAISIVTIVLMGLFICSCICFSILYWEDKHNPQQSAQMMQPKKEEEKKLTAPKAEDEESLSSESSASTERLQSRSVSCNNVTETAITIERNE